MKKRVKEKLLRGSKGAVSVFLVIVLVPMMTISCLFVDMSRVRLANAVVHSAGDLAMNTVLTQYDTLLEQYYGLFATSQSVDELMGKMQAYFQRTIRSSGLSEGDAELYTSAILGLNGNDPIMDILDIALPDSSVEMKRLENASLCNPILLKGQIVNFMKYRAPINTGLALISSLKGFANLSKETDAIDKRTKYYEKEEEVNSLCHKTWLQINEYNKMRCSKEVQFGKLPNDSKAKTYFRTMQLATFDNGSTQGLSAKAREDGQYNSNLYYYKNNGGTGEINPFNFAVRYKEIVKKAYPSVFYSSDKDLGDYLVFEQVGKKGTRKTQEYRGNTIVTGDWYYLDNLNTYPSGNLTKSIKINNTEKTYPEKGDFEKSDFEETKIYKKFQPINKTNEETERISTLTEALQYMHDHNVDKLGSIDLSGNYNNENSALYKYLKKICDCEKNRGVPSLPSFSNYSSMNAAQKAKKIQEFNDWNKKMFDLLQGRNLTNPDPTTNTVEHKKYKVNITVPTEEDLASAYGDENKGYVEKAAKLKAEQEKMESFLNQICPEALNFIQALAYSGEEINSATAATLYDRLQKEGYNPIRVAQYFMEKADKGIDGSAGLKVTLTNYLNACQQLEFVYRSIPTQSYIGGLTAEYQEAAGDAKISVSINDGNGGLQLNGDNGPLVGYSQGNGNDIHKLFTDHNSIITATPEYNTARVEMELLYYFCQKCASKSNAIRDEIDGDLRELAAQMKEFKDQVTEAYIHLNNASGYLGQIYTSVTSGDLSQAKSDWDTSVKGLDKSSSVAAQDAAELENIGKQFKPEQIKALKDRIDKVKDMTSSILVELKNCKYGMNSDYALDELDVYSVGESPSGRGNYKFRNALNTAATNGTGNNSLDPKTNYKTKQEMLINNAGTVADFMWKYKQNASVFQVAGQDDFYPYLKKDAGDFYSYLYNKYGDEGGIRKQGDMEDAKDSEKSAEDAQKDADAKKKKGEEDQKNAEDNIKNQVEDNPDDLTKEPKDKDGNPITEDNNIVNSDDNPLPSKHMETIKNQKENAGDKKIDVDTGKADSASGASGIAETLFSKLGDAAEGLRDNIYISEYVMDMFSYSKGPMEKIGNTASKDLNNNSKFDTSKNEDEHELKSLTMEMISAQNNLAYGSEIEYVLYGFENNLGNIAAAYASIYGVRLCFNLVYAFTSGTLRSETLAIATPISAATLGIIPVPLIQAGLLLVLALAESAVDLVFLSKGEKVNLYKTEDTWICSIHGGLKKVGEMALDEAKKVVKEKGKEIVNKGIDKLTEALNSTTEELAEKINSGASDFASEVDTAIGEAYEQVIGEQIDAAMNEITSAMMSYKELEQFGDEGLEQLDTFLNKKIDAWSASMGVNDNALIGKARTEICKKAKSMISAGKMQELFDKLDETTTTAVGDMQNVVLSCIEEPFNSIRTEIKNGIENTVKGMVDDAKKEVQNGIKQGGEKLKNTLNNQLNKLSNTNGSGSSQPNTGGAASIFAFNYRDYLRLFLLIKLIAGGQETVLLRTADLIQCNMRKISTDGSKFLMSNAACYVHLTVSAYVKPMFLALPLISDCARMEERGDLQYLISYNQKKGY